MSLKNLSVTNKTHNLINRTLKNTKLKNLFLKFSKNLNLNSSFAVGVSGGPDSLALAYLCKVYALKFGIKQKFYIVDHKLRSNSTQEAQYVRKILKKNFIEAQILTWRGTKPKSNIQAIARKKRYDLIIKECQKNNIKHIIFGHHLEDKLENFIIRLTRGSGLRGLVSFDKKSLMGDISIERPLLNFKKNDLVFIASYIFKDFISDPSNENQDFKRVRIRKFLNNLSLEGFDQNKFNKTIENLSYSNIAINELVEKNILLNSYYSKKRKIIFLNKEFFNKSNEVKFRSLSKCIKDLGANYYYARGNKILRIIDLINSNKDFKTSLGGCIIKKTNNTVIINKEYH